MGLHQYTDANKRITKVSNADKYRLKRKLHSSAFLRAFRHTRENSGWTTIEFDKFIEIPEEPLIALKIQILHICMRLFTDHGNVKPKQTDCQQKS